MRRLYQDEWQGIPFSDFTKVSPWKLAGPAFYESFYEEFFRRFHNWTDLSKDWVGQKREWSDFIIEHVHAGDQVLAVGCGLGVIEHDILQRADHPELFIHEVAPAAWKWISSEFPAGKRFVGLIPDCLPADSKFDLVYMATVDYALDDRSLIQLLASIRGFLRRDDRLGRCLLISASFYEKPASLRIRFREALQTFKTLVASLLTPFGGRSQGQLWGWKRTRDEYRALMRQAGYSDVQDGFIHSRKEPDYWISGN